MPTKAEQDELRRSSSAAYQAAARPVVKKKVVKKKPKPPRDREDTAAAAKAGAAPYTPERPSHAYDVPKPTEEEGRENTRAAQRARKKEKQRAAALKKALDQQAGIWAATQAVTPAELNLHPPKPPSKPLTWTQVRKREAKNFAAARKKLEASLPEGYEVDEKAWKAWVDANTLKKPSVVYTGSPADLLAPPLTWQQEMRLRQKEQGARADLAQGSLVGGKAREEFVESMTPAERKALVKSRRPFPAAPKPWEPNLSPFAARIPGAREAMQASHWAEGLLGPEGATSEAARATPGLAWAARNKARDIGVALGADDPRFAWNVRNKLSRVDVGRPVQAAIEHLSLQGFTPSQLNADAADLLDTGRAAYTAAGEAGLAGYRGVSRAATALAIAAQNEGWLTETTPAQRARNRDQIKTILHEGRGAEFGREWLVGPALSDYLEGGPMTPMAWIELTMLAAPGVGFTPLRPAVAGVRAGIKGVRSIPRGGRQAVKAAAQEWNRIQPVPGIVSPEPVSATVKLLGGVRPAPAWRTPFSEQLGLKGVAAKSRFGRTVENKVIDAVRMRTGRVPGAGYGAVQLRRHDRIARRIVSWPGERLERAAKRMNVEEGYAIRALASGVPPLERAAKHREWAAASTDKLRFYAHMVHAELNEKAAKYVMEGPPNAQGEPTVILRPSAPAKLQDTWDYYTKAYDQRQDILVAMNELEQETVDNRIQASGKLFKGGEWIEDEEWAKLQLQTSQARGFIVEQVNKLVDAGRATSEDMDLWMDVIDGQARAWAQRETRRLRRRASSLRGKAKSTDDEDKVAEFLAELEDINEQLANGINPDAYFDDLDRVITGPGRNLLPSIFGMDHDSISFFAALKHWSDETVDKRLASKLDPKKFHQGRQANPIVRRKGYTVVGPVSARAWLQRVKKLIPTQQEQAYWAEWYEDFAGAFAVFGEDAEPIMRGFAASQANQAPAGGITSVLKVMDRLRKGEKVTSEGIGMVAKAVSEAVQGSELEKGVAAKLSDFSDALAGRTTRTWMGGRAEGGAPAPSDIWAARDLGYVDKKHAKRLVKEFGLVEGVDFIIDSPGAPSGLRYERISEQYQAIAAHLNKEKFHGREDWTPAQVQALGWATAQKMVGVDPEDLAFALQRNTRSIDFEITQGPLHLGGNLTPEQVHAVAEAMVPEMRRLIEDTPGIYLRDIKLGISGWAEGQSGSIHIDVIGSQRDIQNMLSRFARAFDQEYVQASREITRAGAKAALALGSEAFSDETVKVAFFKRLSELAPQIPMLDENGNRIKEAGKLVRESELSGYMPGDVLAEDGSSLPGIVIRTGRGYISPKTANTFLGRFRSAVEQVEEELGIEVTMRAKNIELLIGSQYGEATRHARAGSTGGIATLDDPLEAATRKRLTEALDSVRRGERPEPTDSHRYLAAGRDAELGVPHARGDTLDDIIEYMGAADRPHLLNPLKEGPPRVIDVHKPEGVPSWAPGFEWISTGQGMRAIVPGSERPPRWLYRAVSEEEWTAIKENRYLQSDERMNLGPGEGTVTSLEDPRFYLPGKLHSDAPGTYDGRIIRIKYRDEDGWILDPNDQYVKTQKRVPIESIDMVSPKLRGERGTRLTRGGQEVPTLPVYRPVARDAPEPGPLGEPPVPPGHIRLYRGEGAGGPVTENTGLNFTPQRNYAVLYSREADRAGGGRTGLQYVDVTMDEWRGLSAERDVPYFDRDLEMNYSASEYVLPPEIAARTRPVARDAPEPGLADEELKRQVDELMDEATRLQDEGRHAEADTMIAEAENLEDRTRLFAPGEQAHDLVRTEEGDALVRELVEDHPENIKMLWELDPQDAVATTLGKDAPSLETIERAKDYIRDLTWEHLNKEFPDGTVTLYRGGNRPSEEGLIPWTSRYDLALNTYAKGDPSRVRQRVVNIGEIEAAIPAMQDLPGAWYKGFAGEKEYLLWGDDTARRMAGIRNRPTSTGHAASYGRGDPALLDPNVRAAQASGKIPVAGALVRMSHRGLPVMSDRGTRRSFIVLSERHGSAYAVGHEFFHYLETQLTPHQLKTLKDAVGDHGEDVVMAWTTWALMGGGGRLAPIFQQLSDNIVSDLAKLGFSSSGARALPRHIIDLLDTLHNWDDLQGGAIRILDEEGKPSRVTHTAGVAKEAFYPGMPVSLRRKLWDTHRYTRAQGMSVSGRGPIGKQWADPHVKKQLKGHLLKSGLFEADVVRGGLREYFKAMKLDATARVRGVLIKAARESPNGGIKPSAATDYAIKIDPDKTTSKELAKFFDLISDIDSGDTLQTAILKGGRKRRIGLKDLESEHEDGFQAVIDELFPRQIDDVDVKKVAAEIMDGKRGEIPNILWVPRELVEKSGLFEPPWLQAAKRSSASSALKAGTTGLDFLNDLFRITLLLANPAYYPMNLAGNVIMNIIQQGPFALYNLPRALVLSRTMGKDSAFFIDNLMGEGWIGAAEIKSALLQGRPSVTLTNVANMLVDRIPRRAAWLHEALRMGYRTGEELDGLLTRAQRGESKALEDIEMITRQALDEMVDFDNMSQIERNFITRIIFVYPWLRGSTVWTKNFVLNHPIQAAAFAFLYERQQAQANNKIGERPDYLDLFYPFESWMPGPEYVERYGEEYPYGMSIRQMFTMSTTYDIFNTMYGFARGDLTSTPFTEYLQPLYSTALSAMTGYDPFLDKKVDRGAWAFLRQLGLNFTTESPAGQNIMKIFQTEEERRRHAEEGRLYPRNRMDDILRLVFGSLAPGPVNPKTAGKRAREGQAASTEDKIVEWTEEMKDLTGRSPSVALVAIKTSRLRYDEIQGEIRREEGTSDLSPWQLTLAKMRTYAEAHPEKEGSMVRWEAGINSSSEEELKEWDDEFSDALGWDELNEYENEVDEYREPERAPAAKP